LLEWSTTLFTLQSSLHILAHYYEWRLIVYAEISDDEGSGSEHSEGLGVPIRQEKVESVKPEKNGKGKGKAKAVAEEEEEKLEVESHGDEEDDDEDMDEDECVLANTVTIN
jgi:hypothetical protein